MIPGEKVYTLHPGQYDWSQLSESIDIEGPAIIRGYPGLTILRGGCGHNPSLFNIRSSAVRFSGITFQDWSGNVMRLDQAPGAIESFEVERCRFINCTGNVIAGGNPGYRQSGIRIKHNYFDHCRIPVHFPSETLANVWVQNNEMRNISRMGLMLGNSDYHRFPEVGEYTITGNQFYDIDNPEPSDTHAVLIYGRRGIVANNIVRNVKNVGGENCEGIYTKCAHATINGNTLHNAGRQWGQILAKGESGGRGVQIIGNTITDDTEEGTYGIGVYADDISVAHNQINGCARGVFVKNPEIDNLTIEHNKIRDIRGKYGITLAGNGNLWKLTDNVIDGVRSGVRDVGHPMAITINTVGYPALHRLVITQNEISNVGDAENYGYALYTKMPQVQTVKLAGNALDGMQYGLHFAGGLVPQRLIARDNEFCDVSMARSGWETVPHLVDEGNLLYS